MVKLPLNSKQGISKFIYSDRFREILTWTVPPITPLFRYAIDKKDSFQRINDDPELQKKKNKLLKRDLIRDASIYSLGTAFYFGSLIGINKGLKHFTDMNRQNRRITAFLGALALNVVYLSAIASKLSQKIMKIQKDNDFTGDIFIASQNLQNHDGTLSARFRKNL